MLNTMTNQQTLVYEVPLGPKICIKYYPNDFRGNHFSIYYVNKHTLELTLVDKTVASRIHSLITENLLVSKLQIIINEIEQVFKNINGKSYLEEINIYAVLEDDSYTVYDIKCTTSTVVPDEATKKMIRRFHVQKLSEFLSHINKNFHIIYQGCPSATDILTIKTAIFFGFISNNEESLIDQYVYLVDGTDRNYNVILVNTTEKLRGFLINNYSSYMDFNKTSSFLVRNLYDKKEEFCKSIIIKDLTVTSKRLQDFISNTSDYMVLHELEKMLYYIVVNEFYNFAIINHLDISDGEAFYNNVIAKYYNYILNSLQYKKKCIEGYKTREAIKEFTKPKNNKPILALPM